jgi:hypothetical protein
MNVLIDRHHAGLFHSLQLLGARLGWTIYTPTGHDWWDAGVWRFGEVFGDDRLAQQYLTQTEPFDNEFPDTPIAFVTLAEAQAMDWAYVIATVQENQHGFARFARERGATYVMQVGNTGQWVDWSLDPLALVSSEVPIHGRGIVYHQEMDPVDFVPVDEVVEGGDYIRFAASFVNCMSSMGACWDLLLQAEALGVPVDVYGIDGQDGIVKPYSQLVRLMSLYGWGWHDKAQGDGFGHVIHSWAAVGRPLIGHASHYRGRMAEPFWQDGVTCIDLDRHSIAEAVEIVRTMSVEQHADMCFRIREVFDEQVDYGREATAIADFLGLAVAA